MCRALCAVRCVDTAEGYGSSPSEKEGKLYD